MFNIFEQPWTLLTLSAGLLVVVLTIRQLLPEKSRAWQFGVPVILAAGAFSLDFFVQTDIEKIHSLINVGLAAVENEDADAIEAIVSPDYADSFHDSKQAAMAHCSRLLAGLGIDKAVRINQRIRIFLPAAMVALKVLLRFDQQASGYDLLAGQSLVVEIRLCLVRQAERTWLVRSAELVSVDNQPIGWSQMNY